jgi:hypothetical protein
VINPVPRFPAKNLFFAPRGACNEIKPGAIYNPQIIKMKKFPVVLLAFASLILTSCLETVEEVTINPDGSGRYSTTNDMSAVVALVKSMSADASEKMGDTKIDTTISLGMMIDSIPSLTADEKLLMKDGQMKMNVDMTAEKVVFSMHFPFKSTNEIAGINKLAGKLMSESMKKQLEAGPEAGPLGDMPEQSSMESYFEISYKNGQIKKKLNKDKYAGVGSDEYLKGMREAGQMGIPVSSTQVFNLPRPAKSVEGKLVTLSEDKKKVTVKATLDQFFEDPSQMEFEVEF